MNEAWTEWLDVVWQAITRLQHGSVVSAHCRGQHWAQGVLIDRSLLNAKKVGRILRFNWCSSHKTRRLRTQSTSVRVINFEITYLLTCLLTYSLHMHIERLHRTRVIHSRTLYHSLGRLPWFLQLTNRAISDLINSGLILSAMLNIRFQQSGIK